MFVIKGFVVVSLQVWLNLQPRYYRVVVGELYIVIGLVRHDLNSWRNQDVVDTQEAISCVVGVGKAGDKASRGGAGSGFGNASESIKTPLSFRERRKFIFYSLRICTAYFHFYFRIFSRKLAYHFLA